MVGRHHVTAALYVNAFTRVRTVVYENQVEYGKSIFLNTCMEGRQRYSKLLES